MNKSENDKELIEEYLDDSLNEEKKQLFKNRLADSKSFADEVELQSTMIATIKMEERKLLKSELKEQAIRLRPFTAKRTSRKLYYIAAAITSLVVVFYFLLPKSDSLFEAYYVPFPENPIVRSESNISNDYHKAMNYYSRGEYDKALEVFNLIKSSAGQEEILLYIGNCYLSLDQPQEAIQSFKSLIEDANNEVIKVHAEWFLALSFLESGGLEESKRILRQIKGDERNQYRQKASELLNKLRWVLY